MQVIKNNVFEFLKFGGFEGGEINFSAVGKACCLIILCEPKKDDYSSIHNIDYENSKIIIKKIKIPSNHRNIIYQSPINSNRDIQFEYNTEINIFRSKALNRKGLSGRANATIVLETVAIEIVILFLNRR